MWFVAYPTDVNVHDMQSVRVTLAEDLDVDRRSSHMDGGRGCVAATGPRVSALDHLHIHTPMC